VNALGWFLQPHKIACGLDGSWLQLLASRCKIAGVALPQKVLSVMVSEKAGNIFQPDC